MVRQCLPFATSNAYCSFIVQLCHRWTYFNCLDLIEAYVDSTQRMRQYRLYTPSHLLWSTHQVPARHRWTHYLVYSGPLLYRRLQSIKCVIHFERTSFTTDSMTEIVNLVSSRPRVSKLEFYVALALVALAQSGKGVSQHSFHSWPLYERHSI